MNDSDFLNKIIDSFTIIESGITNLIISIKDINSIIVFCSKPFAHLIGYQNKEHLVGSGHALEQFGKYRHEDIEKEDAFVKQNKKRYQSLKIHKFCGKVQPIIVIKEPIINPSTQNVVGIFGYVKKLSMSSFSHQIIKSLDCTSRISSSIKDYKLTKREKQVIFFFLSHLSSQEIAEVLSKIDNKKVSKSTIDGIFTEQLFNKFNVVNRVALRKKLTLLGFTEAIPTDILEGMILPLNELQIY
ncbi:MAG: helix-turn-helix transcriptional regulator [Neisseriaceae bacterium]